MNPTQQSDLLIRVDQNVINLIKIFDDHLKEDKEFQAEMWKQLKPLNEAHLERQGIAKFASLAYSLLGGAITLIGQFFFVHRT